MKSAFFFVFTFLFHFCFGAVFFKVVEKVLFADLSETFCNFEQYLIES